MILSVLGWWLTSSLLGWAAFPLAYRLLHRLPDRGYGVSRALGLLGAGYILWLGASLGLLHNTLGGAVAAGLGILALGAGLGRGVWREMRDWLASHVRPVLTMEVVFLAGYVLWAVVRAYNPEITATEKPMELAFLNAILRSDRFPPADPWLSGYAISYYYFGYVLLALLTRLTGVAAGVAFNLGNALWFGLTALGAYSIVYNLLAARRGRSSILAPVLGPLFVLISGNLEGVLDVLWARQAFWRVGENGTLESRVWDWLNIQELTRVPTRPPSWLPYRDGGFWWWRASRVVHDVNLAGQSVEVIDEFPFFSFLLADNHPHLLALPFVLLALAIALHVFNAGRRSEIRLGSARWSRDSVERIGLWWGAGVLGIALLRAGIQIAQGLPTGAALFSAARLVLLGGGLTAMLALLAGLHVGAIESVLTRAEFWLAAWVFGGLAFLNTWDFPIYLVVLLCAAAWIHREMRAGALVRSLAATGAGVALAGVLLYLPWYPSFSSQASGILPNLAYPTRFPHFLIMFGTSLVPILAWIGIRLAERWRRREGFPLAAIGLGLPFGLLLASWILAGLALLVVSRTPGLLDTVLSAMGAVDIQGAIEAILSRRLLTSWTALLLGGITASCVLLLRRARPEEDEVGRSSSGPFILILIGVGALLVIGPEFLYLRDLFEDRMNTVFKFYFAAWNLWGLAAAFALAELWPRDRRPGSLLRLGLALPLCLGMIYPVLATWTKTDGFRLYRSPTLDGTAYLAESSPSEHAAIEWIRANLEGGTLAEAVGGSYTGFGRISAHTGLATVIGWPFHEIQWRGDAGLLGMREADIQRLYQTRDWTETVIILDQYAIDYVYVGPLEHAAYDPVILRKFQAFMDTIYVNSDVIIFARPRSGAGG